MFIPSNDKSATLLCVLKVLEDFSDAEHPMTQNEIAVKLKEEYGLQAKNDPVVSKDKNNKNIVHRNSIGKYIKLLRECFGYEIVDCKRKGCYLVKKGLEGVELNLLNSSIATAKFLTAEQATALMRKLGRANTNLSKEYGLLNEYVRTNNSELANNLDIVNKAMKADPPQQIEFIYNNFDENGNLVPRLQKKSEDGKFVLNPYGTICNDGNFYLIGSAYDYEELRHFRLDRITQMKIIENSRRKSLKDFKSYENDGKLRLTEYVRKHFRMFNGKAETIKFMADKSILNYIWDTFGIYNDFKVTPVEEDKVTFWVNTAAEGAKVFARQFCDKCEILEPKGLREELQKEFEFVARKYK